MKTIKSLLLAKYLTLAIAVSSFGTACGAPMVGNNPSNSSNSDKQTINHGDMNHGMDHSAMSLGPADVGYDLRFIDGMVPHHEGAVAMAKEVLAKSQRPELKKLANDVIAAQNQEIEQMQKWRKAWYPRAGAELMAWHSAMNHMMAMSPQQISAMRMDVDLGAADQDFDLRFINAMIPHHEGALVMAQDALSKSKRPEIIKLANEIIASQQVEIAQMQQWRKEWFGITR